MILNRLGLMVEEVKGRLPESVLANCDSESNAVLAGPTRSKGGQRPFRETTVLSRFTCAIKRRKTKSTSSEAGMPPSAGMIDEMSSRSGSIILLLAKPNMNRHTVTRFHSWPTDRMASRGANPVQELKVPVKSRKDPMVF